MKNIELSIGVKAMAESIAVMLASETIEMCTKKRIFGPGDVESMMVYIGKDFMHNFRLKHKSLVRVAHKLSQQSESEHYELHEVIERVKRETGL